MSLIVLSSRLEKVREIFILYVTQFRVFHTNCHQIKLNDAVFWQSKGFGDELGIHLLIHFSIGT